MRRLAGPVGLLAAVAFATFASLAAARPDEEPRTGTKGAELVCTQLVADTCGTMCPCLFGEAPHHGKCDFVSVFEVEKGTIDAEVLDHARFALAGSFKGPTRSKPGLDVSKAWVDPSSVPDEKARRKLATFLSTSLAGKRSFGVSMARIQIARDEGPLGTRRFEIEGKALFTIQPLAGSDGKNPVRIENGFSPFPELEPIVVGTASGKLKDPDIGVAVSDGSGEIHKVKLTAPPTSPGS
jgi:hypothetical protein